MMHIIRQQYLHVEVNGTESDGLALQRSLPNVCRNWLTPAIERALEHYASPDEHLYIERLDIDVGVLTLDRLDHDLAEAVAQAIERSLREHILSSSTSLTVGSNLTVSSNNIQHKTTQHSINEAFIYFLRMGTLPWSFHLPQGQSLEQAILDAWREDAQSSSQAHAVSHAVLHVLVSATVCQRLIRQFSPAFLETLLSLLSPTGEKVRDDVLRALRSSDEPSADTKYFERYPWETVFANAAAGNVLPEEIPINTDTHPEAREGIYIDNAGIVLLHPFLSQLFTALSIAVDDTLVQPERALCLLHFLTTGQLIAPEYELVLPKILCNIPLATPVESDVELTDLEKEEAVALLEAVIRHWEVLRNTSPDGLRGTFLLRPGKVSLRDDGDWLLQVESNAYDLLLDQLPWGISMIKLPWMDKMLWVEWR